MAMSANVSDVPPVEVDEDTVTWVLCDVVVAPTLIVVVPVVAVGPLVTGPVVVTVGEVLGDPRVVAAEGLAGAVDVQEPVVDVDPEFTQVVKVFVPTAVVEAVAVTDGEIDVVDVTEFAVLNVPAVVMSLDTFPSSVVTTRL